ncbi:MAG: hypothetical protein CMG11_05640, partial [Candidatus Marinimicrobia bacterium]|nr:hypothetical protein [Candidatus Neomarinimicrobiota bacterium]
MKTLTKMFLLGWCLCFVSLTFADNIEQKLAIEAEYKLQQSKQTEQNNVITQEEKRAIIDAKIAEKSRLQNELNNNNSSDNNAAKIEQDARLTAEKEAAIKNKLEEIARLQNPDAAKMEYYNELHENHAATFSGPRMQVNGYSIIEVAPENGSRDGNVSATVCSDDWSSETYFILLDTTNWWAWGTDGWGQHIAGPNACQEFAVSVPAGNYMFIIADSYGDGGGSADVYMNGALVGSVVSSAGDAQSPYSGLYEAPGLSFDVEDAASTDSTVTFNLDGLDDCGFVSVTGDFSGWDGWGATTDTGMTIALPDGNYEFTILCVLQSTMDAGVEWWNDIWGNSVQYSAPFEGACWNGNYDYPNYTLAVSGDTTVSYCAGSCDAECEVASTCTDYYLSVGGGSYDSEISWVIDGGFGVEGAAGDFTVCLDDGEHVFAGYDSWGDGWNGGSFTITDADGGLVATGTVDGDYAEFPFCTGPDCAQPVLGCTDPASDQYNPDADTDDGSCLTYNGGCSFASQSPCGDFETSGQCYTTAYTCDGSSEYGNAGWGADCADGSDEGAQCCDGTYSAYTEDVCAADCNGDIFGDAVVDCAGECGGSAVVDECGECNGDGSSCNTTCTDYSLSVGGGSYDSEISWDIDGGLGGDGTAGDFTVCLADGEHIFTGYDSWGDGWNGASFTITDADGDVVAEGAVLGSSESFSFCTGPDCAEVIGGCTNPLSDQYNPDATFDDGSCLTYNGGCPFSWHVPCGDFEYSGQCVNESYICDGSSEYGNAFWGADCSDGSDEGAECCESDDPYSVYTEDVCVADCNGVALGDAVVDCAGECGGSAVVDDCGVCEGDGSSCSCTNILVTMNDSFGDGWNGSILNIGGSEFTIDSGSDATGEACVDLESEILV